MIEVKGLKHTYATKSKDNVLALKGVNFSLGDSGMYFIGGKSGCGKSTLLNLLGGLAKIQDGDILFNGVSLKEFSAVEYDAYRASEVGIIFQEFNLIDNLTVGENIELQLNIARANADKEVIAQSLKRVDLEGYERRMPYELSGGQKQRVAIARQLAKGAKVILADEPTGNLDSENATNVFETLKNLSEEIAVIVVSHDMESAYKYGDQIITLKDGLVEKIEVQNDNTINIANQEKSAYKAVKPHFPFKYVAKLARKNIFKRKIRFTISLVLSLLSCVMFCILGSLLSVDANRSLADKLYEDNSPFYSFYQAYNYEDTIVYNNEVKVPNATFSKIDSDYVIGSDYLPIYNDRSGSMFSLLNSSYIPIRSAEDIKNVLGYEMLGNYLPLDSESAYITDIYALGLILTKQQYLVGNDKVALTENDKISDLIGKTFVIEKSGAALETKTLSFKVAGIVKTDYEKYGLKEMLEEMTKEPPEGQNGTVSSKPEYTKEQLGMQNTLFSQFINTDFMKKITSEPDSFEFVRGGYDVAFESGDYFAVNDNEFYGLFAKSKKLFGSYSNNVIFTADGIIESNDIGDFKLKENQVIIGAYDYKNIFGEELNFDDYFTSEKIDINAYNYTPKKAVPPKVGKNITLSLKLNSCGKVVEKKVVVMGVAFQPHPDSICRGVYVHDQVFSDIAFEYNRNLNRILVKKPATSEQLIDYIDYFSQKAMFVYSDYTETVIKQVEILNGIRTFFIVFGSAFLVISLLMFINYISSVIADSKKPIGIIRAIGGTGGSIFKIYYMLGVLFWLVTTIVSSIAYMIVLPLLNKVFTQGVLVGVQFLYYSIIAIGLVAILLFTVMTLASFLPIIKVSRKSPIEVITDK